MEAKQDGNSHNNDKSRNHQDVLTQRASAVSCSEGDHKGVSAKCERRAERDHTRLLTDGCPTRPPTGLEAMLALMKF
ncbi:hypothetical protein J6590_092509 [Homalodisca vitripennis]|nr:hypothetical protein J6590_092509 [Homalodisca vitripennis]